MARHRHAAPDSGLEMSEAAGTIPLLSARGRILLFLATLLGVTVARGVDPAAARIVLLANRDDPDSLRVARHYCDARGVPPDNILALPMPLAETITWDEFVAQIWRPLQAELIRREWIDAIRMGVDDSVGREKCAIGGHRIAYLVTCRGVPLRISHDPARYRPHPPLTDNPYFQTDAAAVDSELSLLAVNDSPVSAFLVNPLFRRDRPERAELSQVVKVTRLDGPSVADALALVDRALEAEREGLVGRAYVDLGGIHPDGDTWLRSAIEQLRELDFEPEVDLSPATFPATARCDAPVFYFGWYARRLNGPFALPGFRFPPGAVAEHIHSDSATTLRSTEEGWTGPLVARGVTATVGNVFEPYLQLLHRPDLLLRALARGDCFGDAAYYAEPVLSWQSIAVGDPLYRPFAVSLARQVADRARRPAADAGYVTLREMHRLDAAGRSAEAEAMGQAQQSAAPSLALGLELARRAVAAGDPARAKAALQPRRGVPALAATEWGLAHAAAEQLLALGAAHGAVEIDRALLDDPRLPAELRVAWLREGKAAAVAAGLLDQSAAWEAAYQALTTGPKK